MKKHWIKIVIGLVILLALTNPTVKDFKEYTNNITGKRTGYFLILSTFEDNYTEESGSFSYEHHRKYIGIFKNFILITDTIF